jgi:hypothetical protein
VGFEGGICLSVVRVLTPTHTHIHITAGAEGDSMCVAGTVTR